MAKDRKAAKPASKSAKAKGIRAASLSDKQAAAVKGGKRNDRLAANHNQTVLPR